jgi:hypothetical protein
MFWTLDFDRLFAFKLRSTPVSQNNHLAPLSQTRAGTIPRIPVIWILKELGTRNHQVFGANRTAISVLVSYGLGLDFVVFLALDSRVFAVCSVSLSL